MSIEKVFCKLQGFAIEVVLPVELFFASCFGFPHIIFGVTPLVDFDSRRASLILVLLKHFELFVKVTPVKLPRRYYSKISISTIKTSCVRKKILSLANGT